MLRYYVVLDEGTKRLGPFDMSELEELIRTGSLKPTETVASENGAEISTLYKLFPTNRFSDPWNNYRSL